MSKYTLDLIKQAGKTLGESRNVDLRKRRLKKFGEVLPKLAEIRDDPTIPVEQKRMKIAEAIDQQAIDVKLSPEEVNSIAAPLMQRIKSDLEYGRLAKERRTAQTDQQQAAKATLGLVPEEMLGKARTAAPQASDTALASTLGGMIPKPLNALQQQQVETQKALGSLYTAQRDALASGRTKSGGAVKKDPKIYTAALQRAVSDLGASVTAKGYSLVGDPMTPNRYTLSGVKLKDVEAEKERLEKLGFKVYPGKKSDPLGPNFLLQGFVTQNLEIGDWAPVSGPAIENAAVTPVDTKTGAPKLSPEEAAAQLAALDKETSSTAAPPTAPEGAPATEGSLRALAQKVLTPPAQDSPQIEDMRQEAAWPSPPAQNKTGTLGKPDIHPAIIKEIAGKDATVQGDTVIVPTTDRNRVADIVEALNSMGVEFNIQMKDGNAYITLIK